MIDELLPAMLKLFILLKDLKVKFPTGKCCFFAKWIRWCSRLLFGPGIKFDPSRSKGIEKMKLLTTDEKLQQLVFRAAVG